MTQKLRKIFGLLKDTSFKVNVLNREFNLPVERRIILFSTSLYLSTKFIREEYTMRREGWKSQTIWGKKQIQLYWYCRKGRNSVLYYNFTQEFVPMKRSEGSSSLNSLWGWKQAHVVSSRGTAYLWDKILQVTFKVWEYEILSSVNLGRKEYELRMWFWSANFGNRELRMVQ